MLPQLQQLQTALFSHEINGKKSDVEKKKVWETG